MLDRTLVEYAGCRACQTKTRHRPIDWSNHPLAGHGYGATEHGIGWSSPEAKTAHEADLVAEMEWLVRKEAAARGGA